MKLNELFTEKNVELDMIAEYPEDIIRAGGNLLLKNGSVREGYIDEMLNSRFIARKVHVQVRRQQITIAITTGVRFITATAGKA